MTDVTADMMGGDKVVVRAGKPGEGTASPGESSPTREQRPRRGRLVTIDPVLKHERQGRWSLRWLLLAFLLIPGIVIAVNFAVIFALEAFASSRGETSLYESAVTLENIAAGNGYAFVMLALVGVGFAAPAMILGKMFRNRWWLALTYDAPFRWYNFVKAASALAVLLMIATAYGLLTTPEHYSATDVLSDPPPDYALWFGLGLLAILVQSFGEELLFRGLLPRILGTVIPIRFIAVGLVMLLFIGLHTSNPDVKIDLTFIMILFVVMEILNFTILFRTRSIAATWGIHWINNSFIFLLLSTEPGRMSSMVPFVYRDPVWSSGGSYLLNPAAYLEIGTGLLILCAFLFWKHSPFYLPWHDEAQ
ncbi:MAG: CPBP family intramembrane glutamic endopeptidase [Hyphomicrobiaceae bacterium]